MNITNPYAIYVYCDGAMDYNSENSGGVGIAISFPDFLDLDDIHLSFGQYIGGNIEILEMEALIQAMEKVIDLYAKHRTLFRNVNQIIFVTDRFSLSDSERTNPYRIRDWRKNKWKNFEGKPIKNHKLLDTLDKTRKKLVDKSHSRVKIEYRRRKYNKTADKLAKTGKQIGVKIDTLSKKGEKIGRRKFEGKELNYKTLSPDEKLHIHVFRKDPVQDEWEVWVELCSESKIGRKLKLYVNDELAAKLQRRNEYIIKIRSVFTHHVRIYETIVNVDDTE